MLRLNLTAEPRWLEMAPGVRFLLAPCTSTVLGLAREAEAVQALIDSDASETELTVALAKEVGNLTIREWEGVGDENGRPVAVSPETVSAVLDVPMIFQKFQLEHVAHGLMLAEEKNVSAPSPNGTSAAARNTARPVRSAAKSAPAKSTSRKR